MAVDVQGTPVLAPVLINNAGAVGGPAIGQSYTDQRYPLLSRQLGNNGNTYLYVYATASIAQYLMVQISAAGKAVVMTPALNVGPGANLVGFTDQGPLQATSYGWITVSGLCSVKFKKGTHGAKPIFVSGTNGWLTTSLTTIASALVLRSRNRVLSVVAVTPAAGLGSVGCTATDSGDVRPILIVNGAAFVDQNIVSRNA
jgi:hypothetical protein